MAAFDVINVKECPNCSTHQHKQTKLFHKTDGMLEVGEDMSFEGHDNYVFKLKNNCYHCEEELFIVIVDGKYTNVLNTNPNPDGPTLVEKLYGARQWYNPEVME